MWKLQQHCGAIIKDSCRKYVIFNSSALATMQYEVQVLSRKVDVIDPAADLQEWSESTAVQLFPSAFGKLCCSYQRPFASDPLSPMSWQPQLC